MKTRHDKNVTDYIGVIYAKTEIELSGPIELSAVCYENKTRQ